jgi:hypothetical protein
MSLRIIAFDLFVFYGQYDIKSGNDVQDLIIP